MKSRDKKRTGWRFFRRLSRRDFFRGTGLAALAGTVECAAGEASRLPGSDTPGDGSPRDASPAPRISIPTYESIGVKPVINCWGTMTILGGSLVAPEVEMAMEKAARGYVNMDELMEGVGKRLAELTGAEWGCVTSGAAAGLSAATCACVAGADPEKIKRLPHTRGMKNEVLVPRSHRHVYDHAIWMVGVDMIEVETAGEMEAAVSDRTAMIAVLGEVLDRSDISLEDMVGIGKKHGVPVMVDAAAERPDVPDRYIQAGVDLVAYSGGKCLRGPQCTGLLLGRKDLVEAAFLNVAPHHSFGRPMKVGKEEVMGALAAMELWVHGRDHKAEWREWERKLKYISDAIAPIPSVTTKIVQPRLRSNIAPTLSISWSRDKVRISPREAHERLLSGDPRIQMPARGDGLSIMSYMLEPRDEIPVARRLHEVLSSTV